MSALWTPDGAVNLHREKMTLPTEYVRMLIVFANTSHAMGLNLICSNCGQPVRGANNLSDANLGMECGCRVFKGGNPTVGH